jgi:hypothetical protein
MVMSGFSGAPLTAGLAALLAEVLPAVLLAVLLAPPVAVLVEELELHALTPTASAATAKISGLLKRRWTFIVLLLFLIIFLTEGLRAGRRTLGGVGLAPDLLGG